MILVHSKVLGRDTSSRNVLREVRRIAETLPIMPMQQLLLEMHSQVCSIQFVLLDPIQKKAY